MAADPRTSRRDAPGASRTRGSARRAPRRREAVDDADPLAATCRDGSAIDGSVAGCGYREVE
ncbi:hypothetical protein DOU15_00805 [Clavibacter michiganensis subsp. michiganensis]|nr:hypothetical protein [Clavibacter michiganensis subsp. michiganensis]